MQKIQAGEYDVYNPGIIQANASIMVKAGNTTFGAAKLIIGGLWFGTKAKTLRDGAAYSVLQRAYLMNRNGAMLNG